MKQKRIIIYRSGISGGTATLSLRIFVKLIEQGFECYYIYYENNDINNIKYFKEIGIVLIDIKHSSLLVNNLNDLCSGDDEIIVVTYSLKELFEIQQIQLKFRIKKMKSLLYVVHPNTLVPNSPLKIKVFSFFFQQLVVEYYKNNQILFMDRHCYDKTAENFNILEEKTEKIFLLPMLINNTQFFRMKNQRNEKGYIIMTILRAEFPFKGYVFGLIDQFVELQQKYPFLKLRIISFGSEESKIKDKIDNLDVDVRKNIYLIGRVPYTELTNFFKETSLYIGMGTTVLDAANYGVPSLVVKAYTYDCVSSGYFSDSPFDVGAYGDNLLQVKDYILKFLEMSENDLEQLRNDAFLSLKNNYDIEIFINRFFDFLDATKPIHKKIYYKILMKVFLKYSNLKMTLSKRG